MEDKGIVIVTGSCGRIGSQIVQRLCKNYVVVGFEVPRTKCVVKGQIPIDLGSDESVMRAFQQLRQSYGNRIASVIHLAAYYSFKEKFSPLYNTITVEGTKRLLKELRSFEVDQFLFTSTELVHKPTKPGVSITEDSPIKAHWGYPISKIQTERLICEKKGKMSALILRIAGVYDDFCHSIPISNQIQRIYEKQFLARLFSGNIHHGASFVHMEDLIDALELAVNRRNQLPEELVLLIGEPKTLSYDQMQRLICKLLYHKEFKTIRIPKILAKIGAWVQCHLPSGCSSFIRPWMIDYADDHYEMNIDRAKKFLGWVPKHRIEETLPKMIDSLRQDPEEWYRGNGLVKSAK